MSTTVKLTSDPELARHGCGPFWNRGLWEERYKGADISIGLPIVPTAKWTCGTDLIWPVSAEDGGGFICRHQFEAGD